MYLYRSLSTFKREFKNIFNENPHKWILNKKLEDAKSLLLNGEKASEIYLDLGFNSLQHFSKAFKERFNINIKVVI